MRNIILYGMIVTILLSCKKSERKPVWLNSGAVLHFHFNELKFSCDEGTWEASLLTSIQPIALRSTFDKGVLTVESPNKGGIISGPAQLCLTSGDVSYFYPVHLINKKANTSTIVFRSPKTVNPDSGLVQQRIRYDIDEYRNIIFFRDHKLFDENELLLLPKAGTYKEEGKNPLNSYYVQAGSCVQIPVKYSLNLNKNVFEVTVGPLRDQYDNLIADGTLVTFVYQNEYVGKIEVNALKGFAFAKIPAISRYTMYAQIGNLKSKQLFLKP